jgi:hypothetical protein
MLLNTTMIIAMMNNRLLSLSLSLSLSLRRICCLALKTFCIVAAITIIVIAAAVSGGLGATEAQQKLQRLRPNHKLKLKFKLINNPTPTTSDSTSSLTTTPVVGPSTTLLRDCPSSNDTLYTINPGAPMTFRKICGTTFLNAINGTNVVETTMSTLNDCINPCGTYNEANKADITKRSDNVL